MKQDYWVLAYYHFVKLEDAALEVKRHKTFFEGRDVAGRIYISEQGINGQMSGVSYDAESYMAWLREDPRFADVEFKIHYAPQNVFPRMTVKLRDQLVAIDEDLDVAEGGAHASPAQWRQMLEDDQDSVLVDVRNDYEWEIGHFEGAQLPQCRTFREFRDYADELKDKVDPHKTRIMMYCTGGIRCELYSALLKRKGFENVVQLQGGVIKYGQEEGNQHWKGKLFVFDDRMAIPLSEEAHSVISSCHHCGSSADEYYNCANMDCNKLFISCTSCRDELRGCCQEDCLSAPRVRPLEWQEGTIPFRRVHHYREAASRR